MKTKKRIASKLFAALVVLTLISCCFLGTTFARYTSTGSGSAAVDVAKWTVLLNGADMDTTKADVNFGHLSPSMAEYSAGGTRTNVIGDIDNSDTATPKRIATIENFSEVAANLTVSVSAPGLYNGTAEVESFGSYNKADIEEVFSIQLYYSDSATFDWKKAQQISAETVISLGASADGLSAGGTVYIYATITWTSDFDDCYGSAADARDTWIGKNVTNVKYTLTYTAVQASELPE